MTQNLIDKMNKYLNVMKRQCSSLMDHVDNDETAPRSKKRSKDAYRYNPIVNLKRKQSQYDLKGSQQEQLTERINIATQIAQKQHFLYHRMRSKKTALLQLVQNNLKLIPSVEITKLKKIYDKLPGMENLTNEEMMEVKKKKRIVQIFFNKNKEVDRENKQISYIKRPKILLAKLLVIEAIREIEEFVNVSKQTPQLQPLPQESIFYFYGNLVDYRQILQPKDADTFALFLKAVCIWEDVSIPHQAAVKLYEGILEQLRKKIKQEKIVNRQQKRAGMKSQRISYQPLHSFWTPETDRLMLAQYIEKQYFSPVRKYFIDKFPEETRTFSQDFFRLRLVSLLRKEIQRIQILTYQLNEELPVLLQPNGLVLSRILKATNCLEIRLMLSQTYLSQTADPQVLIKVVMAINVYLTLKDEDQLRLWKRLLIEEEKRPKMEELEAKTEDELEQNEDDEEDISLLNECERLAKQQCLD